MDDDTKILIARIISVVISYVFLFVTIMIAIKKAETKAYEMDKIVLDNQLKCDEALAKEIGKLQKEIKDLKGRIN